MSEERKVTRRIRIEDAVLTYKNFKGAPSDYNAAGSRNFGVHLSPELADDLMVDGWKVKFKKPREDDPDQFRQPWLPVKVRFTSFKDRNTGELVETPLVYLISSKGKIRLTEETIDQLDWTIIKYADVLIRPYNYPARANIPAGVAAYLAELYVEVDEEASARRSLSFRDKYNDLPEMR